MELIAFGGGTTLYRKDQPYEARLTALKQKGVILAQCLNTLKEKKISKGELLPLISYVPSGNGELISARLRAGRWCIGRGRAAPAARPTARHVERSRDISRVAVIQSIESLPHARCFAALCMTG